MKIFAGKRPALFLGAAMLLSVAFIGMSYGTNSSESAPPKSERTGHVQRYVLDNGMTVLLKENHFAPVVAVAVWVKVGSADETESEEGLAHVHEHMLFKGTENRGVGQIANEVERAGGDINAYTSIDETVYHLTIPSNKINLGLDILSDAMFRSSFNAKELKKELQVVLEEIKRGEDNPAVKLQHTLFKTAYKKHPYGKPVIGTEASVSAFTRNDVVSFYKRWYTPDNMVLVVVGDLDTADAKAQIQKYFGAEKNPNRKKYPISDRKYPQEQTQKQPRVSILTGDVQEAYLDVAFHIQDVKGEDIPALELLSYILGNGESSRLYRNVQAEKGLVHAIYTYAFTPRDPGLLLLSANLDGNKFIPALEAMLDQTASMKVKLVGADELTRAKTNIESESIYSRETMQGFGRKIGFYEAIVGDVGFENEFLRKVGEVSAEDIRDVAAKYLNPDNITVAVYLPSKSKSADITESAVANIAKNTLNVKAAPQAVTKVKKIVLSNGMTLIIKENHAVPVVSMRLAGLGGVRFETEKERGINNFIARTLTKGTAKRSAEEIADEVDRIAGSLGGFSGRDSFGLAGEFLSRNFDEGLDLFADVLINPTFVPREVEQQRREIIASIKLIEDSPEQLISDLFRRTLYPNHPYGNRAVGEVETVEKMTRQELMTYYRSLLSPRNLVLSVVGDIRAEEAIPKIERAFSSLKDREFTPPKVPRATPIKTIKKAEIVREKEQAQIIIGFQGASFKSEDRYALDVLAAILGGQGGRLFVNLRDMQHLAYAVGAVATEAMDPGFFYFYIGTRPDNREKAIAGMLEEIERIRAERVKPEELDRAKEYIAGSYYIGLQTNSSQAASLSLNERYGLGWEETMNYPKKIKAVTAAQVLEVAQKYLQTDRYVLAVLTPSSGGQAPAGAGQPPK